MFKSLQATGIGVKMHYSPVPLQPFYLTMSFGERQLPEGEGNASCTNNMWLFQDLYKAAYLPVRMISSEQSQSQTPEVAA